MTKSTVQRAQLLVRVVYLEVALKQKEANEKKLQESFKILQENQKRLTARISQLESKNGYKYTGISNEACGDVITNKSPLTPDPTGKDPTNQVEELTPVENMCIAYT